MVSGRVLPAAHAFAHRGNDFLRLLDEDRQEVAVDVVEDLALFLARFERLRGLDGGGNRFMQGRDWLDRSRGLDGGGRGNWRSNGRRGFPRPWRFPGNGRRQRKRFLGDGGRLRG